MEKELAVRWAENLVKISVVELEEYFSDRRVRGSVYVLAGKSVDRMAKRLVGWKAACEIFE